MDKINFFCLKWGEKYDATYVNRLNNSIKRNLDVPFQLTCITDNADGIDPSIGIIDYTTFDPFDYDKDRIFTREKLVILKTFQEGRNIWLDLDILIHENITEEVTMEIQKPTFIWNYWNPLSRSYDWYGKGASCHVNSSFVMWDGDMGNEIWDFLIRHEKEAFFTYKSLDKFLFYQCYRKGMMDFWPEGFVSNFNREGFKKKGKISLFNTSHIHKNRGITEVAFELDELKDCWASELWESYEI